MAKKLTKNSKMIKTGIILMAVGFFGLIIPFLSIGFSREENFIDKFTEANQISYISSSTSLEVSESPTPRPQGTVDPNAPNIKSRLIIPVANINMALIESKSESALWRGGWVYPGGSTPDKGGNTVVFGHRFRYLPPVTNTLYHLDKVKMGDRFEVQWKGQKYEYQVSEIKVVNPTDVYVLDPSTSAQITLVTCFPLFSTAQRLVVIGQLVGSQ